MSDEIQDYVDWEQGWPVVDAAIKRLIAMLDEGISSKTKAFDNKEFMRCYHIVYNMCTQPGEKNKSSTLYDLHSSTIFDYLTLTAMPSLRAAMNVDDNGESLLRELKKRWENHVIMNKWMRKLFMYLDRYHVPHHALEKLEPMGIEIFKINVFNVIEARVCEAINAQVRLEREGEEVDKDLISACVGVFRVMEEQDARYHRVFEASYLKETAAYYKNRAEIWMNEGSTSDYLIKAEKAISSERQRVADYLHESTLEPASKVVLDETLRNQQDTLLSSTREYGFESMLRDNKTDDLRRVFSLYKLIEGGLTPVAKIAREFVTRTGIAFVNEHREKSLASTTSKTQDVDFVDGLLLLLDKFDALVSTTFENHPEFQRSLKAAFERFVNLPVAAAEDSAAPAKKQPSNSELISIFCDRVQKPSSGDHLSEEQIESKLESVVRLFNYLHDKDLFAYIYRNQLAKRLLSGRSASDDAERSMVSRLKAQCGSQFTSKIEGMITDFASAAESRAKFATYSSAPNSVPHPLGQDFTVQVLTKSHWPDFREIDLKSYPPELVECMASYEAFYATETDSRKLTWIPSEGSVTMKINFPKRAVDAILNTLQAACLMAFQDSNDSLTFEELAERLNLDEFVLKRVLHSLSCGKAVLLTKSPASKSIKPTDSFSVNTRFQSRNRVIRVPMASLEETHNPKRVAEDRTHTIEAAIVRVMKTRKTMEHQELVGEVASHLHFFKPTPADIKQRIEALIERDYLERDENNRKLYNYLA